MSRLIRPGARLVDAAHGVTLDGESLSARVDLAAAAFDALPPGAVFTAAEATTASVIRYLGAFEAGRAVLPVDPGTPPRTLAESALRFAPALLTGFDDVVLAELLRLPECTDAYEVVDLPILGPSLLRDDRASRAIPHPDLGVLLGTSGSTGRPKLVRLARSAVLANTESIAAALDLRSDDVAVTALPLFYSYGLSVLNSHLWAGATVVLSDPDVTGSAFWKTVDMYGVTSLALVPSQYEMLRRLRWSSERHGRIRSMTCSGGRLRDDTTLHFHNDLRRHGGSLSVMYGQTEAGPRIASLSPDRLPEKLGSVGPGIPGVSLSIRLEDGTETVEPGRAGEVVCRGPGVMMGYAEHAGDLAQPDMCSGTLRTGDLGRLDHDGCLFLTGRISRLAKVFGVRIDLAAVEHVLAGEGPVAAVAGDDRILIWIEGDGTRGPELARTTAERLRVHRSGVEVRFVDRLPALANGKTDYRALEAEL